MIRSFILASFLVTFIGFAGDVTKRAVNLGPMRVDVGTPQREVRVGVQYQGGDQAAAITWVAVDTMANAFGPASRGVKPIAYDSATGVAAVIYRGATTYAAGSGELWYSVSRNTGATWRRTGNLNGGIPLLARYPSCAISNPTQSTDTSATLFVYAAPQLLPGAAAFGNAMYGVDFPMGAGAGAAFEVIGDVAAPFWSNAHIWTSPTATDINWVMFRTVSGGGGPNDLFRWHTNDFATVIGDVPPTWAGSNFANLFGLDIAGHERNGKHYMSKWGVFTGDLDEVYNVGYSVSTDGGTGWSTWTRPLPDWRSIPGLGGNYDWWGYGGPGAFSFDMIVDAQDRVHFFGVIQDTLTLARSLVEIYETGSGWASKIIKSGLSTTVRLVYPGAVGGELNQTGNHLNASTTKAGDVMALVWLDGGAPGDTLTDIWFSWRRIDGTTWSAPENLTQTPGFAELLLHAAPTLKTNSTSSWTMFIGRCYESGVTSYPPESANRTVFYVGTHTWTATSVDEDKQVPVSFSLSQNYPNPFNPSTKIAYALPAGTDVSLRVYNALGQEVATLVNGYRAAGSYEADFTAANLASGIYYYTLRAGQFAETKKMALIR